MVSRDAFGFDPLDNVFTAEYKVGEEKGFPVVAPPPGADIYLVARMWSWAPILKLKKDTKEREERMAKDATPKDKKVALTAAKTQRSALSKFKKIRR